LAKINFSWVIDNILFPRVCIICSQWERDDICCDCSRLIERSTGPCSNTGGVYDFGDICYYGRYVGVLKESFSKYKFHGEIWRGQSFGRLLFSSYKDYLKEGGFSFITYVPISKESFRKRGFDQCYEIARELSKVSKIKLIRTLVCKDQKAKQSSLGRIERDSNVSGRFNLINECSEDYSNKRILLVDDIITTGATIRECACLLKNNGADRVDCMVFATGRSDISTN